MQVKQEKDKDKETKHVAVTAGGGGGGGSGGGGGLGGERVISGLRPKGVSANTGKRQQAAPPSTTVPKRGRNRMCHNPLDRLCELLLPWRLLDEMASPSSSSSARSDGGGKERKKGDGGGGGGGGGGEAGSLRVPSLSALTQALPTCFREFEDYVTAWEPLVIEEIKASVVTNVPMSTRKSERRGVVQVSCADQPSEILSPLAKINCSFGSDGPTAAAAAAAAATNTAVTGGAEGEASSTTSLFENDRSNKDAFATMDLVLLSMQPVATPLNAASAKAALAHASQVSYIRIHARAKKHKHTLKRIYQHTHTLTHKQTNTHTHTGTPLHVSTSGFNTAC